jgi:hypothetical protein
MVQLKYTIGASSSVDKLCPDAEHAHSPSLPPLENTHIRSMLQLKYTIGASSSVDKLYAEANQAVTEAVASIRVIHVRRV